jgi:hypothetical protein
MGIDFIAGGQAGTQSASHVEGKEVDRDIHLQPDRIAGAADGFTKIEHLADREFMAVADNIMDGPALFRREIGRIGVGQIEG